MKISFVLSFNASRVENLKQTLRFLKRNENIEEAEFILVCQDRYEEDIEGFQCINLNLPSYDQPKMTNFGIAQASNEIIALLDADRLFPPNYFQNVFNTIQKRQFVSTWKMYKLNRTYSDEEILDKRIEKKEDFKDKNNKIGTKNLFAGSVVFFKENYLEIGGMDERYQSYGMSDSDITQTVMSKKFDIVWRDDEELHLYHDTAVYWNNIPVNYMRQLSTIKNALIFHQKWNIALNEELSDLFRWVLTNSHLFDEDLKSHNDFKHIFKKPVLRWTLGNILNERGYEILDRAIQNMLNLYGDKFNYFICFNCEMNVTINNLREKYKNVYFIKQKWEDCPIPLNYPTNIGIYNQKLNGSMWKVCPARLNKEVHELILDNDIIFMRKSEDIDKFLECSNKNFVTEDAISYLGAYRHFFKEENPRYNSGIIGLKPNYDFGKEIYVSWFVNKSYEVTAANRCMDYGDEQGLLMYTLLKEKCIIGKSEEFIAIHPEKVYTSCVPDDFLTKQEIYNKQKKIFNKINLNDKPYYLDKLFKRASTIHFLGANRREKQIAWDYFSNKNNQDQNQNQKKKKKKKTKKKSIKLL